MITVLKGFVGVLPPTGKRFAANQSHWFRVAGNKLVEHWATREDLPMLLQSGSFSLRGGGRSSGSSLIACSQTITTFQQYCDIETA